MSGIGLYMEGSDIDVGVDIGKRRIAISWPWYGIVDSLDLHKPGRRRDHELRLMQELLRQRLPDEVQLWVDQPFAGNGGVAAAQSLSETLSAVLTVRAWHREPRVVHQSTWKKHMVGNHLADKSELNAWLHTNYLELAEACNTEDEVDATVIALYGKSVSDGLILPLPPKRVTRKG